MNNITIDEWAKVDKTNRRIYKKEEEGKMKKKNIHTSDCAINNKREHQLYIC